MDKKMTLTEDELRLAAAYLNLDAEGQTFLETFIKKIIETPIQTKSEKVKGKNEKDKRAENE